MRVETGDTDLRGGFPETRTSAVAGVRSADRELRQRSHGAIVAVYWKPVYKYLRLRWREPHESAQDLTQEFFARAFEKGFFERFDASKARFRTYLRTCLDALVANERQASQRLKRGGGTTALTLDFDGAAAEIDLLSADASSSLESVFDREWVRSLFSTSVDEMRGQCEASGRSIIFELFLRYDLEGDGAITYDELGKQFGLSTATVTNHLAAARRDFRGIVLEKLRDVTASDEEFRLEARALFRKSGPESSS